MSADRLYHEMGLKGYQAEDTWMGKGGDLFVLISVPRESLDCRKCGCHRVHVHEWRQRFWKGAPLGLTPVIVTLKTPRVKCLDCGSRTWHQPKFAEGQRQVTKQFERCVEGWLSRVTIQDAVATLGVSWNTAGSRTCSPVPCTRTRGRCSRASPHCGRARAVCGLSPRSSTTPRHFASGTI